MLTQRLGSRGRQSQIELLGVRVDAGLLAYRPLFSGELLFGAGLEPGAKRLGTIGRRDLRSRLPASRTRFHARFGAPLGAFEFGNGEQPALGRQRGLALLVHPVKGGVFVGGQLALFLAGLGDNRRQVGAEFVDFVAEFLSGHVFPSFRLERKARTNQWGAAHSGEVTVVSSPNAQRPDRSRVFLGCP